MVKVLKSFPQMMMRMRQHMNGMMDRMNTNRRNSNCPNPTYHIFFNTYYDRFIIRYGFRLNQNSLCFARLSRVTFVASADSTFTVASTTIGTFVAFVCPFCRFCDTTATDG